MEGYIRLWRKIMNESFYMNAKCYHIATHLLMIANHKDKTFLFNNQEITIKRGQLLTGRKQLSLMTGESEQECRSALTRLQSCKFITIKSTNKYSVITVNKYEEYQGNQPTKLHINNQQITNKQPTDNQQITTNNNDNNDKNEKNDNKTHTAIVEFFNQALKTKLTLSPERQDVIVECMERGRSVDMIKQAIVAYSKDDWHKRGEFCDLIYAIGIVNNIDKFDKWYNFKPKNSNSEFEKIERMQRERDLADAKQ
jgi:hypothetical protein